MVKTIIQDCNNHVTEFKQMKDFMDFVKQLYKENEEHDTPLRELTTYKDCILYIMLYCDGFTVCYSDILHKESKVFS